MKPNRNQCTLYSLLTDGLSGTFVKLCNLIKLSLSLGDYHHFQIKTYYVAPVRYILYIPEKGYNFHR